LNEMVLRRRNAREEMGKKRKRVDQQKGGDLLRSRTKEIRVFQLTEEGKKKISRAWENSAKRTVRRGMHVFTVGGKDPHVDRRKGGAVVRNGSSKKKNYY